MCPERLVSIFVYGTLKKGFSRDLGCQVSVMEDEIDGTMFTSQDEVYPMVLLDTGDTVKGEVHVYPFWVLECTDRIEGEGSIYARREVITKGGRPVYTYEWLLGTDFLKKIEEGEWLIEN
jgi:gamma-glutamylcyclotransferase (GGCT)/AIG2-like uncharacterized protein YtfP